MRKFVKGLRVELQRALAPLPPMGFAAARKTVIGSAATLHKRPRQGPWKSRDSKRPRGEQRIGNKGRRTLTPGGKWTCGLRNSVLKCNKHLQRHPEEQPTSDYERSHIRKN
ncbi:hypothetical protein M9H77_17524 [Catharanthus roseus]|uniref:Uncharacterized protein n=1 Tax=Catharanthus roseus TaxID=4058 RepID=A0ACC0B4W4_CATRO|nr:hypothetical protein M9H77_17524 [Catharanthus roseus]